MKEDFSSETALEERLPNTFNRAFARRYLPKVARVAREHGVLGQDEEVVAFTPCYRMSPWWGWLLLFGIVPFLLVALLLERAAWVIVTDRRIIVTPWSTRLWASFGKEVLRLDRPVQLALTHKPKRRGRNFTRNRIVLPGEVAAFLRTSTVYVRVDHIAADACRIAGTPGTEGETALRSPATELAHIGLK